MEIVAFNGWERCIRLHNGQIELIVTRDVGPRIIRCAFLGRPNLFAEIAGQQGGTGEPEWMIRGGHRFWVGPEAKPWSYELDNAPYVTAQAIAGGIRTEQAPGPLTGLAKSIDITLADDRNRVTLRHQLTNRSEAPVRCAPWALTVMGPGSQAIIPLPAKIPHTERLTHNQRWSLWGYTDLSDPRWTLGQRCLLFRQDPSRGPNKLGIAHAEGWVGAQREGSLLIKTFHYDPDAAYPDGGCNFETFSNEAFLEVETLGAIVTLMPGGSVQHTEVWDVHDGIPLCRNDVDVDTHIRPLVAVR